IRGLMRVTSTMNPFRAGVFAWEVISHKLLRWLIPLFLLTGTVGSVLLALGGFRLFQLITLGAAVLLLLACAAHRSEDRNGVPAWRSTAYCLVRVKLYWVRGTATAARGETEVTWTSARPGSGRERS